MGSESALVQEILRVVGSRPDVRLWRSQPLVARGPSGRVIRALPNGHPDLMGCIASGPLPGRMLAIECKAPTGRVSPSQEKFLNMLMLMGALVVVARSVEDVTRWLPALPA